MAHAEAAPGRLIWKFITCREAIYVGKAGETRDRQEGKRRMVMPWRTSNHRKVHCGTNLDKAQTIVVGALDETVVAKQKATKKRLYPNSRDKALLV